MDKCGNFMDVSHQTIALAYQLVVEQGVKKGPNNIVNAIQTKKFQTAVAQALKKEAQALIQAQNQHKKLDYGTALFNTLKSSSTPFTNEVSGSIQKSPEYSKVKSNLKQLECSFKKSSVGIFIEKNQTWLIVVGVVAGLGGAVGLYYAREGDILAGQLPRFTKDKLKVKVAGILEVGANLTQFKPSTRALSFEAFTKLKLEGIQVSLRVSTAFKGLGLTQVTSLGNILVPVTKNIMIRGNASLSHKRPSLRPRANGGAGGYQNNTFDLGLDIDIKIPDRPEIKIWYKYKNPATGRPVHSTGIGVRFSF